MAPKRLAVLKSGHPAVDFFHAAGLALVIAEKTQRRVRLTDRDSAYQVEPLRTPRGLGPSDFKRLLKIPLKADLNKALQSKKRSPDISLLNFDGLAALLVTTATPRLSSVADLSNLAKFRPELLSVCLQRAKRYISRMAQVINSPQIQKEFPRLLDAYEIDNLTPMQWSTRRVPGLIIPMPLAPTLSYSFRETRNTGSLFAPGTNIQLIRPPFARLLVLIGAIRFLRAQPAGGKLLNYYTHLPATMWITPNSAAPLLRGTSLAGRGAILLHTLAASENRHYQSTQQLIWHSLQTQGSLQPICVGHGVIDFYGLRQLISRLSAYTITYWHQLLSPTIRPKVDADLWADSLLERDPQKWLQHVKEVNVFESYSVYPDNDVKEVLAYMSDTQTHPLIEILKRDEGTVRFGRALRLIKRANKSVYLDLFAALSAVQTEHSFLRALQEILAAATLMSEQTIFFVIPNDADFIRTLDDVHRFGLQGVVDVLLVLSSLRYPRKQSSQDETSSEEGS